MATLDIRPDDLSGAATRALVGLHLEGMHATSPACSVHALDIDGLRDPAVTFWSAWAGDDLAGIGALKALGPAGDGDGDTGARGEIKSMRVADAHLGTGVGRAMLAHIIAEARARGMTSLWLETGSTPDFLPAVRLYESVGFTRCGPFDDYTDDPFSIYLTLPLT